MALASVKYMPLELRSAITVIYQHLQEAGSIKDELHRLLDPIKQELQEKRNMLSSKLKHKLILLACLALN